MNFVQIIKLFLSLWPFYVIIFAIVIIKLILEKDNTRLFNSKIEFPYEKKPFLFDSVSELNSYKILLELFGDEYHIFAQVNYSHLIRTKDKYDRGDRSKIDKKSADFVLCDKDHVIPVLVIELDGDSHKLTKKQERDEFINRVMNDLNFPILHLKTDNLNKEFIRSEIDNKLIKK